MPPFLNGAVINKNMRCIEIVLDDSCLSDTFVINKNMRCIEICSQ